MTEPSSEWARRGPDPAHRRAHRDGTGRARRVAGVAVLVALLGACGGGDEEAEPVLSPAGEQGREVAERLGCANCHSVTGRTLVGPTWKGVWASSVELDDGTTIVFDEEYVETAVRDPAAQRRPGDWPQMPVFPPNALSDDDLASIVAYIRDLADA